MLRRLNCVTLDSVRSKVNKHGLVDIRAGYQTKFGRHSWSDWFASTISLNCVKYCTISGVLKKTKNSNTLSFSLRNTKTASAASNLLFIIWPKQWQLLLSPISRLFGCSIILAKIPITMLKSDCPIPVTSRPLAN